MRSVIYIIYIKKFSKRFISDFIPNIKSFFTFISNFLQNSNHSSIEILLFTLIIQPLSGPLYD